MSLDGKNNLQLSLPDLAAMQRFGETLAAVAQNRDVILLIGNLGAGKTTLTRFIARGLAVPEDCYVTSPSFNLLHTYPGRMALHHIDCYRLNDEEDVEGAGLVDYLGTDGLTVIEWPDRLGTLTPAERLEIEINSGETEEQRSLHLRFFGDSWIGRMVAFRTTGCCQATCPRA